MMGEPPIPHGSEITAPHRTRMSRGDRRRWRKTRSLADVAELTALWLEGAVASQPNYRPNYGPDEETKPLIPMLAAWNRAGFLTNLSQPGVMEECEGGGVLRRQRAAVEGFVDRRNGQLIVDAAIAAKLWVVLDGVTVHGGSSVSRGLGGGVVVTELAGGGHPGCFGGYAPGEWARVAYKECGCLARQEIVESVCLAVIDPVYDRNDVLWPVVNEALVGDRPVKAS